jgi:hypothetical protein
LGYSAEHAVEMWLRRGTGAYCFRPRAGSIHDVGDLLGLPFLVSVKNHAELRLGEWTSDLERMVLNAKAGDWPMTEAGIVVHKRRGRGSVDDWYVTTSGRLAMPLLKCYVDGGR